MSEDMKPIASEVENNVEQPVVTNPEAVAAPVEEIIDYSNKGLKELVDLSRNCLTKAMSSSFTSMPKASRPHSTRL